MCNFPLGSVFRLDSCESICLTLGLNIWSEVEIVQSVRDVLGLIVNLSPSFPFVFVANPGSKHVVVWDSLDVSLEPLQNSVDTLVWKSF